MDVTMSSLGMVSSIIAKGVVACYFELFRYTFFRILEWVYLFGYALFAMHNFLHRSSTAKYFADGLVTKTYAEVEIRLCIRAIALRIRPHQLVYQALVKVSHSLVSTRGFLQLLIHRCG